MPDELDVLSVVIKAHIDSMLSQLAQPRYGLVQSFDPATYTARVLIQPENELSGWLPVLTQWLGNGWGLFAPPSPGDQVKLVPQESFGQNYAIVGAAFSTVDRPLPAPSGEFWLVHAKGQFIKLLNDGTIFSAGTWNHDGDFRATGAVIAGFGTGDQVGLQTHTHQQGNDSHGDTEVPTEAPTGGT